MEKQFKYIHPELKELIIGWIFENMTLPELSEKAKEEFRPYLYGPDGKRLPGSAIYEAYIEEAAEMIGCEPLEKKAENQFKHINLSLKDLIIDWIYENRTLPNLTEKAKEKFRPYIYSSDGYRLAGSHTVEAYIEDRVRAIAG